MNIIVFMGDTGRDNQCLFLEEKMNIIVFMGDTGRDNLSFFEIFHYKKNYRAGSHCGEMKDVVRSDPPQAENPAGRIFFCCLKMEKRSSVG